jgi:hypothetical protein
MQELDSKKSTCKCNQALKLSSKYNSIRPIVFSLGVVTDHDPNVSSQKIKALK